MSNKMSVKKAFALFLVLQILLGGLFGLNNEVNVIEAAEVSKETVNATPTSSDNVNWSEVTDAIIVYDDGTTIPRTAAEAGVLEKAKVQIGTTKFLGWKWGSTYKRNISSATWINRGGMWSLSLRMTSNGKWGPDSNSRIYQAIWNKHSRDEHWRGINSQSMYNQFACHRDYARFQKSTWNLEPSRPDKGYWGFVGAGCN